MTATPESAGDLVERNRAACACYQVPGHLRPCLRCESAAAIERLQAERDARDDFLRREGYRPCDIPACNCGRWHRDDTFPPRYREWIATVEKERDALREKAEALDALVAWLRLNADHEAVLGMTNSGVCCELQDTDGYVGVAAHEAAHAAIRDALEQANDDGKATEQRASVGSHGDPRGASGPALAPDEAQAETASAVARSGSSRGITGHQGSPPTTPPHVGGAEGV